MMQMTRNAQAIRDMFATVSLGAPENAVGFVLWRLVHRYQREVDRALLPVDLTHLQFTTLAMAAWLGREGDEVNQSELAGAADIHPMQVSHMLAALEAKAFVRRKRSTVDVRAKRVEPTANGVRALREAMPLVIAVQERMFGEQGRPDGDLLGNLRDLERRNRD
jgi:DNA-binding MarR family transcriptional regulator